MAKKNKMKAQNAQNQNQFDAEFAEEAASVQALPKKGKAAKQQMNK
ncbi:hypothetical protein MO973_05130 [Paenibacillus sp. TRM 82003]|nr:hypothetical protein [Paenibacillus sp. TRM 82003]